MSLTHRQEQVPARSTTLGGAGRATPRLTGGRAARWFFGPVWLIAAAAAIYLTRGESQSGPSPPPPAMPTIWTPDIAPIGTPPRGDAAVEPAPVGETRGQPSPPSARGYRFRRLVGLGQPAPGGGFHGGSFEIDGLNRNGQAVVGSDLENTWGRGEALYLLAADRETRVAAPGDPAPGGRRYGTIIWMPPGINVDGQVVWAGQMENGETWLLTYDARTGRTAIVERPGMNAPGGGEFQAQGRQRIVINNAGDIAFDAYLPGARGASPGVFVVSNAEMRLVAREGTPAPDGDTFRLAEAPALNDAREIVFHAIVSRGEWLGVYLWQDGFISPIAAPASKALGAWRLALGSEPERPGEPRGPSVRGEPLSRAKRQAPSAKRLRAETLQAAFYPQIDARGGVVFVGRTERGDGLYRWSRGVIAPILTVGDPVPGVGRLEQIHFHRRRPFFLNARGEVAFSGQAGGRSGAFVWSRGAIHVVARAGERLPGVGTLTEVGSPETSYAYPYSPIGVMGPPPGARPPGMSGPPYGYVPPRGVSTGYGGYLPPGMSAPPSPNRRQPTSEHRAPTVKGPSPSTERRAPSAEHRAPSTERRDQQSAISPRNRMGVHLTPRPPSRHGKGEPEIEAVATGSPFPASAASERGKGAGGVRLTPMPRNRPPVPYGMPGGAPYGGYFGQPFGLVLSDDGKLLLPAMVDGRPCVLLAIPLPRPGPGPRRCRLRRQSAPPPCSGHGSADRRIVSRRLSYVGRHLNARRCSTASAHTAHAAQPINAGVYDQRSIAAPTSTGPRIRAGAMLAIITAETSAAGASAARRSARSTIATKRPGIQMPLSR